MLQLEIFIAVYLLGAYIHYRFIKRRDEQEIEFISKYLTASEELKRTLAMGLYLRYRRETDKENLGKYSNEFIKGDPIAFEFFVANMIKIARGGSVWVSPASNDNGVDFEHTTEDGLYLGQVKCEKENQPFDPIALIHSNMVKRDAVGGYVITTSSFTENAKKYAEGLNIELIDGTKLVDEWIESLKNTEEKIKQLIPRS